MKSLLLSLGHGSSAVLIVKNKIVCGYENERLSGLKSDSNYPQLAIEEIEKHYDLFDVDEVLISHWFTNGLLPAAPNKYFNIFHISNTCPQANIKSVNQDFTHHDAHMFSAKLFAGQQFCSRENTLGIVCDGFGTMGETLSIYKFVTGVPKLYYRTFGFSSSLGLLYQYATSYLGLKENQDEYKLLGYEPQISQLLTNEQFHIINELVVKESNKQLKDIGKRDTKHRYDPIFSIDALPALKMLYFEHFDRLIKSLGIVKKSMDESSLRTIIAYYVQSRLEHTLSAIVSKFEPDNLLLSGGVFMNVKLNNVLSKIPSNKTCIMPLCGDQGAPLGIYESLRPGLLKWPGHLFWGKRDFNNLSQVCYDGLWCVREDEGISSLPVTVSDLLNEGKIINLVRGSMEFGSRSLCNTSTLALPTKENVDYINALNGRNTIMPMAPVMSAETASSIFEDLDRIHESCKYMIATIEVTDEGEQRIPGAIHKITRTSKYSGRPQITDSILMLDILASVKGHVLINTSFNVHSRPIAFNERDVIDCHEFQKQRDIDNRVITIVIDK